MAYQPKSYRKFLATSVAAAMVATSVAPAAFAAEAKKEEVSFKDFNENSRGATEVFGLVDAGFIQGDTNGNFNPDASLKRGDAAVIIARTLGLIGLDGKVLEGVDTDAEDFTDVAEGSRYYTALAALRAAGIIGGKADGSFAPTDTITRGEMAIIVAKAFKLEAKTTTNPFTDLGKSNAAAIQALYDNDITKGTSASTFGTTEDMKRRDFSIFTYKSAVQAGIIEVEAPVAPVTELKVESVSAINLNQFTVTFNQAVEKEYAEDLSNYTLNNGSITAALNNAAWTESPKATLQADGKTVLVTLDTDNDATYQTLQNQIEATLTVKDVKSVTGQLLASTEKKFSFTDSTVPTVDSVRMEGNKVIVIKFSEFVKPNQAIQTSNYQIDGVSLSAYGVSTPQWDAVNNEVRIPLTQALADKTYKLTVSVNNSIEDAVGYKLLAVEKDLTVVTDTTVGAISEVVVAADKSHVLVKFTKALAPTNFVNGAPLTIDGINVFGSGTIGKAIENGALKLTPASTGEDFASIIANGVHAVNLVNNTNNSLVDAYGIKVGAGNTTYSIVADTLKPTVENVKVNSGATSIEVKFSEAVSAATAQNRFNYTLKNSSGNTVNISSAMFKSGSSNTVVLNVSALAAGNYTLDVQNVKDLAGNTMDNYNTSLNVADLIAPTVTAVHQGSGTNSNAIYVYYSEAVNTATATNTANYLYDNKALPAGTSITALSASAVKITLPSSVTLTQGKAFAVSNQVTDIAGNAIAGYGYQTTVFGTVSNNLGLPDTGTNVTVVDKRTVKVTLNKELKSLTASDFQFKVSDGLNGTTWITVPQQNVSYVNSNGKATITFVFNADVVDTDGKFAVTGSRTAIAVRTNQTGAYSFGSVAVDDTSFVNTAIGGSTGVDADDKIAPTLISTNGLVTEDTNNNGQIDRIRLTFTEAIDNNFLAATSFAVSGYTVSSVANGGFGSEHIVYITVAEKTTPDTDATPNVTRTGVVKDAVGNEFTGLTTASATVDLVGPSIVSSALVNATTIEVTLSEAVVSTTIPTDGTGFAVVDLAGTPNNYAVSAAALKTGTNNVIVLTVANTTGFDTGLRVNFTTTTDKYEDLSGNDTRSKSNVVVTVPTP